MEKSSPTLEGGVSEVGVPERAVSGQVRQAVAQRTAYMDSPRESSSSRDRGR